MLLIACSLNFEGKSNRSFIQHFTKNSPFLHIESLACEVPWDAQLSGNTKETVPIDCKIGPLQFFKQQK